jgi:hypothetical protein
MSLQGCFYIGFSVFYVYLSYFALKALFEIRDQVCNKPKKIVKPVRKKR